MIVLSSCPAFAFTTFSLSDFQFLEQTLNSSPKRRITIATKATPPHNYFFFVAMFALF
jgi:hypothetical protein